MMKSYEIDRGYIIITIIVFIVLIGFLCLSVNQSRLSQRAGFCYGKEGVQLYPYAEIGNVYFNTGYDMNYTKRIDCNNIRSTP